MGKLADFLDRHSAGGSHPRSHQPRQMEPVRPHLLQSARRRRRAAAVELRKARFSCWRALFRRVSKCCGVSKNSCPVWGGFHFVGEEMPRKSPLEYLRAEVGIGDDGLRRQWSSSQCCGVENLGSDVFSSESGSVREDFQQNTHGYRYANSLSLRSRGQTNANPLHTEDNLNMHALALSQCQP